MSATAYCHYCGGEFTNLVGGFCPTCLLRKQGKSTPTPTPTQTLTWELVLQQAGGISPKGSFFSKKTDEFIDDLMTYVGNHIDDDRATDRHEEDTFWTDSGDPTMTVDYQGTRAGGGAFWIDIQGQQGRKGSRNTYWQIMIQTGIGLPSEANVALAIASSIKNQRRSVVHREGGPLPTSGTSGGTKL